MPRCQHKYLYPGECWCIHCSSDHGGGGYTVKRGAKKKVRSR